MGKYVLHVSKLWASKQPANGQNTRMFGVTLKLRRVEVHPRLQTQNTVTNKNETPFIDSDDEDEVDQNTVKHFVEADAASEDDDDDSEDDSEEEEEEEVVV